MLRWGYEWIFQCVILLNSVTKNFKEANFWLKKNEWEWTEFSCRLLFPVCIDDLWFRKCLFSIWKWQRICGSAEIPPHSTDAHVTIYLQWSPPGHSNHYSSTGLGNWLCPPLHTIVSVSCNLFLTGSNCVLAQAFLENFEDTSLFQTFLAW